MLPCCSRYCQLFIVFEDTINSIKYKYSIPWLLIFIVSPNSTSLRGFRCFLFPCPKITQVPSSPTLQMFQAIPECPLITSSGVSLSAFSKSIVLEVIVFSGFSAYNRTLPIYPLTCHSEVVAILFLTSYKNPSAFTKS